MKHLSTSIVFIAAFLTACSQEHPTLDDFIIDDEITVDAKDLFEDDKNKGVELEKDATGGVVFSVNPPEEASSVTSIKEEILTVPETITHDIMVPHKTPKEVKKIEAKKGHKVLTKDSDTRIKVQSRPRDFAFVNKALRISFFDPNALGLHLLGIDPSGAVGKTAEIQAYNKAIMEMKASYEERNLSKMRTWRDQKLISVPRHEETLFYPFSGPDVVNMLTFFPNQQTYVMMGMEYVGTVDTIAEWQKPLTTSRMETIRKAVESVFIRSFFRTLDMSSDFSKNGTRGVLPGMLLMLKLMDRDIKSVQWVTLNDDGALRYLTPDETKSGCANFGLEINILHPTQGYEQTIYYFKTDLADKAIIANKALRQFIENKLGTTVTFVKSASFLMHMKEFNWMRNAVLNISRCVLQDDTGVPFKYYKPTMWSHHLYGQYVGPYGDTFAAFKQPELNKAYESMPLQLLDFNFGYGYAKIPSHLMMFIRKEN